MGYATVYTNGVIAVKEGRLLGDKIYLLPAMREEEARRVLAESGFGSGDDPVAEEEAALDTFIREYAPTAADKAYFLAPRDFHNWKALEKAKRLGVDPAPMLAPTGLMEIGELEERLHAGKPPVPALSAEASGAEIGAAYDNAMYGYLFRVCAKRPPLKRLLRARVDMTNILTACRAQTRDDAEKFRIAGGTLAKEQFFAIVSQDPEARAGALAGTPYREFYKACLTEPPFTAAERRMESFEEKYFSGRRYGLEGREPFLYYVFRRRAEIRNVRAVLASLRAGVRAEEIEKRLTGGK